MSPDVTPQSLNVQLWSVIVAALAVSVSAVMQYLTIRMTRKNTVSGLEAATIDATVAALRRALAQHLTLTYKIETNYQSHRLRDKPLPADHDEVAGKEDRLF